MSRRSSVQAFELSPSRRLDEGPDIPNVSGGHGPSCQGQSRQIADGKFNIKCLVDPPQPIAGYTLRNRVVPFIF